MLVVLRVTIGWHFLYEGVWKITNAPKFSAEPFLSQAKGPAAPLFYAMLPDFDGRQRLAVSSEADPKTKKPVVKGEIYRDAWSKLKQETINRYQPSEEQTKAINALFDKYDKSLTKYLADNAEDIAAHFNSLDRFLDEQSKGNNGAPFQKKRAWDRQGELRVEVNKWLKELDAMGAEYRLGLWDLLNGDQRAKGMLPELVLAPQQMPVPVPMVPSRSKALDLAVTYSLTAIGLCVMVGFCTRLACLGGVAFLISVLLTQPPWPPIYPPAPEVVGHALVVDKNFVEMIAMLALATLPVGRWGGLDIFLYRWFGRRVQAYFDKSV